MQSRQLHRAFLRTTVHGDEGPQVLAHQQAQGGRRWVADAHKRHKHLVDNAPHLRKDPAEALLSWLFI